MGLFGLFKKEQPKFEDELDEDKRKQIEKVMEQYHVEKSNLHKMLEHTKKKAAEIKQNEDFFSQSKLKELSILDQLVNILNQVAEKDKIDINTDRITTMQDFCNTFQKKIAEFTQDSSLEFTAVKKILATEINQIRNSLVKLEKYITDLQTLLQEHNAMTPETEKRIDEFAGNMEQIEKTQFPELNEKYSMIADDTSYADLLRQKDEMLKIQFELEADLESKFNMFRDSLLDYHNQNSDIGILGLYLNSPLSGLMGDQNLEILKHLDKLAYLVKRNRIDCENPKKEWEAMKLITKPYMLKIVEDFKKAAEEIEHIENKMKEHHIDEYSTSLQKRIKSLAEKTEVLTQSIHKFEIDVQEQELAKIDSTIKKTKENMDE